MPGVSSAAAHRDGNVNQSPCPLTASRHTVADLQALQALAQVRGWSDGLPVMPPTAEAVHACLAGALLTPDHLIGIEPVRERAISAEKLAINAVMAGCTPAHFPLVVTAFSAMLQPEFLLHGATASTGGAAILVVINGPARDLLGMNGGFNALGASDPAANCIGRALRLALYNLLDARPGEADRSTLGHPGKLSYCLAEDEANSPWPSLASERGCPAQASAVTVMAAGAPRQLMNEWTRNPEEILDTYVAEIRASMRHYSIWAGNYAIVITPQLRTHFADAGWSRADIQAYVFRHARIAREEWRSCGKGAVVGSRGNETYCALTAPDDLLIIAAGGPAGGFGAVIPPWLGPKSRAVTLAVGACTDCGI